MTRSFCDICDKEVTDETKLAFETEAPLSAVQREKEKSGNLKVERSLRYYE